MFLGFGFVSAPRILPLYWGAFRFFNKIAYYLSKKKKNKMALLKDIERLDGIEEHRQLFSGEKLRKNAAIIELEKTILLEEVSWRQKSRKLWIRVPSSSIGWLNLIENVTR
jgi:hypothetical protein